MKKCLVILGTTLLAVMLVGSAFAQTTYGAKAGLVMAKMSEDAGDILDTRTGFAVGGFAEITLSPGLTFVPELMYIQKGAREEDGPVTASLLLDYVDVSLFAKKAFPGESISPYILAGPVICFNTKAELELEFEGETETEDMSDAIKSTSFSGLVGAGVGFQQFLFEIRYQFSLTGIDDTDNDEGVKNNVLMFLAGMNF